MLKQTANGTKYLTAPEVMLIAVPSIMIDTIQMREFLRGLDPEFEDYLNDSPHGMTQAEVLTKFAGQWDYQSFGPKRTKNVDAQRYLSHIIAEKHGNVLEMAQFVFACYGISRSCTHEIVRHRAGFAYSQASQRYIDNVRFVERPEYQVDEMLHDRFERRIDKVAEDYEFMCDMLVQLQKDGSQIMSGDVATERRKRVRGAARSVLPNETEAPIIIGANIRAWRYFIEQRAHPAAEIEIRRLAFLIYEHLMVETPMLLHDYTPAKLLDGTWCVETTTRKV